MPLNPPLDPATRDQFEAFMGRDPHPSGGGQQVAHIKEPTYPQFHFEWHPQRRKVYMARIGRMTLAGFEPLPPGSTLQAEVVHEHCDTRADAINAIKCWLRGFREGQTPDIPKPHLEG